MHYETFIQNNTSMTEKISSSNTKAQILNAYEELLKQVQSKKGDNPKELQKERESIEKVSQASSKTEEGIVKNIAELKLAISESLDSIGQKLLSEQRQFQEIQEAIAIERKKLENLYGISANADSLTALVLAQEEKRCSFEEEMAKKEKEYQEKMAAEKACLESEIEKKRDEWEREKKAQILQVKEEKDALEKQRKREQEDYQYTVAQQRKKEQDAYALQKENQERELIENKAAVEKEITEREKSVAEAEEELLSLRKQVEQKPQETDKAVKDAEARVSDSYETRYKFEKELQAKETEGELKLREQTIKTLQDKIKEQDTLIKQLTQKSESSEKTVKDIALKAIESTAKTMILEKDSQTTGKEEK